MNKNLCLISIVILLEIFPGMFQNKISAQIPWISKTRRNQKQAPYRQLFMYETFFLPTIHPDTVQFLLYTKIANDLLQFILKDTLYLAQYELTIDIRNVKNESVAGKIKKGEVSTQDFTATNSRNLFKEEKLDFHLSPGEYTLFIEILDLETQVPLQKKEKIKVPDFFSKSFTATKLLFLHKQKKDSTTLSEHFPVFPAKRSPSDSSFRALLYLCSDSLPRGIHLKKTLLTHDKQTRFVDSLDIILNSRVQSVIIDLDQKLTFGQYTLQLEMTDEQTKIELENSFHVQWGTHPSSLLSLDQAIEPLLYLMPQQEFDRLKKLSNEEQKKAFEKFWKKRDPDPDTEENELEEEYYRRVSFTNKNFSTWEGTNMGWKTDRGRIYIIYGPPSDVERPLTSSEEPSNYEIWYYRNLHKRFVFIDKYGSGDYRLISEE